MLDERADDGQTQEEAVERESARRRARPEVERHAAYDDGGREPVEVSGGEVRDAYDDLRDRGQLAVEPLEQGGHLRHDVDGQKHHHAERGREQEERVGERAANLPANLHAAPRV